MPQHARWAEFLARLRLLVLDELHVYSGIFGSNMAHLLAAASSASAATTARGRRSSPARPPSATPRELAERLTGRPLHAGRPRRQPARAPDLRLLEPAARPRRPLALAAQRQRRGPRADGAAGRAGRAHHHLLQGQDDRGDDPPLRVRARSSETAPHLAAKVTPYRGGYLPEERREIERRLFSGELLGVSTTPRPGAGHRRRRAGRQHHRRLPGHAGVLLPAGRPRRAAGARLRSSSWSGLDTSVNQYVMSHPELPLRPSRRGRPCIDPDNPFVVTGHLRCATHELPLPDDEAGAVRAARAAGAPRARGEPEGARTIDGRWYHAAAETPAARGLAARYADAERASSRTWTRARARRGQPATTPSRSCTRRRSTCTRATPTACSSWTWTATSRTVKREEVDYYTQPLGRHRRAPRRPPPAREAVRHGPRRTGAR